MTTTPPAPLTHYPPGTGVSDDGPDGHLQVTAPAAGRIDPPVRAGTS